MGYINKQILKCHNCKKQYDLIKVAQLAARKNERAIRCPYCGEKHGELN